MLRLRRLSLVLVLLLAACRDGKPALSETSETPAVPAAGAAADVCGALQAAPPDAPPPSTPLSHPGVRILAFGDFGTEGDDWPQERLAEAMAAYGVDHPYDLGLTLGDNFYPDGLSSPVDPRWDRQWERLYTPMGIRFYAVLGNHDYHNPKSPGAEIARSRRSPSWCLPRTWYTFTAGPVQLFAVDTTPVEEPDKDWDGAMAVQRQWLDRALAASRARWKVVFGHHPIYSNGHHSGPDGSLPRMRQYLLPVLVKNGVDLYLAGHDHDLQVLEPESGVHFAVSGAGGRNLRRFRRKDCSRWGLDLTYGFTVLEADEAKLTLTFVGRGESRPYRVLWGPAEMREGEDSACRRP
jgi:tartrate-resistant acid phosphatase type 5